MESFHRWRNGAIVTAIVLVAGILFLAITGGSPSDAASTNPSTSTTTVATTTTVPATDPVTGLPIVDGGNPADPISGTESNADSRTPVVRAGDIVTNWAGLDALLGNDASYTACVSKTTGMNWGSDVPKFKSTENADNDPRYILAVNTTVSNEAIRKIASNSVNEDLSGLKILRVGEIVNTRGFTSGSCQEFVDRRSMVRVSLSKFVYASDGSVKGLQSGTGVFVDCHNPWRLPTPSVPARPGSTTTTTSTPGRHEPTTTTSTPGRPGSTTTTTLEAKDPAMDPAPQGNAPVGGGANLDPGPGQYIPPGDMVHPPSTARVNPPPPPPASVPPAGSHPDPAPAPAPEPNAPPPDDPATGYSPPPGM